MTTKADEAAAPKKKRGRKPKADKALTCDEETHVTSSDTPPNIDLPQIINIKKTESSISVDSYEKAFCEYNPNIEVPDAYKKDDYFSTSPFNVSSQSELHSGQSNTMQTIDDNKWPMQTDVYCFWCAHPFTCSPVGIPVKHSKDKFYCVGNFCSFSCAASYNYELNDSNTNIWERFNLLNLMAMKCEAEYPVKCAKPRTMLKIFGGKLDIDTYRKENSKTVYLVHSYPMIAISDQIEELSETFTTSNTETFTIKRETKTKQPTIQQTIEQFY